MNALCWAWVISPSLNIAFSERAQESHDSVGVVCRGRGVKCHCVHWPRTKCREQIKMRTSVTVIPNNRMENVSPNEECQPRFAIFYPNLPRRHLLIGNNTCLKLPGCGKSRRNWDLICQRESGGVLDNVATRQQQHLDASPSSPSEAPIISSRNVEKMEWKWGH